MMDLSWLSSVTRRLRLPQRMDLRGGRPRRFRPLLETLEDRCLLTTVTTLLDNLPGSLREAIARTEPGGTVDFEPGLTGTITLTAGQLTIDHDLTIAGPGAEVITVRGNNASRVFRIAASVTVTLAGLTITNGRATGANAQGGGIFNAGTLEIAYSIIRDNSVSGANSVGGGIYNAGTLTVNNSTLSGNTAVGGGSVGFGLGGGVYNAGTLAISGSTLSGNAAVGGGITIGFGLGGGVYNAGTLTVSNSTLRGNAVRGSTGGSGLGGGIANGGTLTISGSTLSGNTARGSPGGTGLGGAVYNGSGTLIITGSTLSGNAASGAIGGGGVFSGMGATSAFRNTIVAGNTAPSAPDVSGALNSQGHNLIGIGTGGSGFTDTDLVGTAAFPLDPQLEPLGDYGGPTRTMRPLPGSPVINAGDNTDAPETDQRGLPRIVLSYIDIGAVELQPDEFAGPTPPPAPAPVPAPASAPPGAASPRAAEALFGSLGEQARKGRRRGRHAPAQAWAPALFGSDLDPALLREVARAWKRQRPAFSRASSHGRMPEF